MTDRAFERILHGAVNRMPQPSRKIELEICDRKQRRRWRKPLAWAAVLALVLLVGRIGYAAYGLEYGAWVTGRSELWTTALGDAKKAGIDLSEQYGDYVFSDMTELSVVPHGTSWQDALLRPVYRAYSLVYQKSAGAEASPSFSITLGSTAHPYWRTYFGYDEAGKYLFKDTDGTDGGARGEARGEARTLENSRWEYGGFSVTYECYEDSGQIHRIITWQNPKTETCMCITWDGDTTSREEMFQYARMILDENM